MSAFEQAVTRQRELAARDPRTVRVMTIPLIDTDDSGCCWCDCPRDALRDCGGCPDPAERGVHIIVPGHCETGLLYLRPALPGVRWHGPGAAAAQARCPRRAAERGGDMSASTVAGIPVGPCPHCVAGQIPLDGHTTAELRDAIRRDGREAVARRREQGLLPVRHHDQDERAS